MKPAPEYLKIKELAQRLGIGETSARALARSQHLRQIKGAVLNTNPNGKYERLRIRFDAAVKVLEAYPLTYK